MNFKRILFISIFLFIMSIGAISAADLNETSSQTSHLDYENPVSKHSYIIKSDSDYISDSFHDLQHKIDNAPSGSLLSLSSDYHTNGKDHVIKINKDLTIDGNGHKIEGITFFSSEGNVVLKNLKFIEGSGSYCQGGAIHLEKFADYTIESCSFEDMGLGAVFESCKGGAIYNGGFNPLTIKNSLFKNNCVDNYGGAIYSIADLYIKDSSFLENFVDSDNGGAIYACAHLSLERTYFEGNSALVDGGAIFAEKDVDVVSCTLNHNFAGGAKIHQSYGGAICAKGNVNLHDSQLSFNTADDYGGAIYAVNVKINQDPEKSKKCTFLNNQVTDNDGGAIYAEGEVSINNSYFGYNQAIVDGGAIYARDNVKVFNTTFSSNYVGSYSPLRIRDHHGGAIFSINNVCIDNSTFKNNQAIDWGGAVYGYNIKINSINRSLKSFFIGNVAWCSDGGALFALKSIEIFNAEFFNNTANTDGGAMRAKGNVRVVDCIFGNNSANIVNRYFFDYAPRNYGGAIRADKEIFIDFCTFEKNYSGNFGGAIYANSVKFANTPSYFYNNSAEDDGGAIYANKFSDNVVKNIYFKKNIAKCGDGGAVYINKENKVSFNQCIFIYNHCKDEGGAIYLDSRKSHLTLTNNLFRDNDAGKTGQSVFNCGYYDEINNNCWNGKNPSSKNDQLIEWKVFKSNNHHTDKNPSKLDFMDFLMKIKGTVNLN